MIDCKYTKPYSFITKELKDKMSKDFPINNKLFP